MRSPGLTPSIWLRLEALGDSEFNSARSASRTSRDRRNVTDHEQIVASGSGDFDRAFHMLLTMDLGEIIRFYLERN
jgi:hypothetical protein